MPRAQTLRKLDRALKTRFGLHLVWPISAQVTPGQIFVRDEGFFQPHSSLSDYGVTCPGTRGPGLDISFSSSAVRETAYVGGTRVSGFGGNPNADAQLDLEFKAKDAFFLRARPASTRVMRSPGVVARKIANRVSAWRHLYWFVVTEVWSTSSFVLLASRSRGAKVSFRGRARAVAGILRGDFNAGLDHTSLTKMELRVLGETNGAVAMRLARVRIGGALDYV